MKKLRLKVKRVVKPYDVLSEALENAVRYGIMKHNKWTEDSKHIDEESEKLLVQQIDNAFFVWLEENNWSL